MKKHEKPDLSTLTGKEKMKYEIAEELGLLDRVLQDGWKSLSAKETGKIGGIMTKKMRKKQEKGKKSVNGSLIFRFFPFFFFLF